MKLTKPIHKVIKHFITQARSAKLRTMREFAEQEIVLPDGPYRGERFNVQRQPYTRLAFDAIDSGLWSRFAAVGPTQSGKTLTWFIIPILYHLFEVEETVICGVPNIDMADDKWTEDLLPAILSSRYANEIPVRGSGSRGGKVGASIKFRNGATLRFMTGGSGDKAVAGYTARIVVITEVDGMDKSGGTSKEADRVTQFIARTRSWGQNSRVYMECTTSTSDGRIWIEYQDGTESKILPKCPLCQKWVEVGREHLVGWQGAEDVLDARELSMFACPSCGEQWTDHQRELACRDSILVHRGQVVDEKGVVHGDAPRTETLGFRWSAMDNLLVRAGDIGVDEWRGSRALNEENAEKELCQFVWALPYDGDSILMSSLDADAILARTSDLPKGLVPSGTEYITVGIDVGKFLCHWVAIAWSPEARCHIFDYGRLEVPSADLGVETALKIALQEHSEDIMKGWPDRGGTIILANQVWVDSGWMPEVVYGFCRTVGGYLPSKGYGASQDMAGVYRPPKNKGGTIKVIGDGYHVSVLKSRRTMLAEIDVDAWKTFVHNRLQTLLTEPGSMTLHAVPKVFDHLQFAKHLVSERQRQEYEAGKGYIIRWDRLHKNNHWLDATVLACAAGHFCGVRLEKGTPVVSPSQRTGIKSVEGGFRTPDGRAFFVGDRR